MAGLYGNPVDYPGIEKICKDFGIKLIDDAAQSFGAKLNGRLAGTWGDAGFFPFLPGNPHRAIWDLFFGHRIEIILLKERITGGCMYWLI